MFKVRTVLKQVPPAKMQLPMGNGHGQTGPNDLSPVVPEPVCKDINLARSAASTAVSRSLISSRLMGQDSHSTQDFAPQHSPLSSRDDFLMVSINRKATPPAPVQRKSRDHLHRVRHKAGTGACCLT
eukprot:996901-Rhodomonas_salina.3